MRLPNNLFVFMEFVLRAIGWLYPLDPWVPQEEIASPFCDI